MNDAIITPHATAPAAAFVSRRPRLALTRNPRNGRSGISSNMRLKSLPLECCERIGVERFLVPEQPDDNREADGRFSRGDGHDEEDDDLPVQIGRASCREREELSV